MCVSSIALTSLRLTPSSSLSTLSQDGPVVMDVADTDAYASAAAISRQLPGMFLIQRKKETVLCHGLATEEMYNCIVKLHRFTGYDASSGFYGKGQAFIVRQSCKELQRQLARMKSIMMKKFWKSFFSI